MPKYVIINDSHYAVRLPPPLGGTVKPRTNFVLETEAVNVDTVAMKELLNRRIIRMIVTVHTPTISDHIEIPVVDMLGSSSGNLNFLGPWQAPDPYVPNDIVQYGGQSWVALTPNVGVTPVLGSPAWTPLSESMVWRGTWSIPTPYHVHDVVFYGGTSWIATAPSTGVVPVAGPFWTPLVTGTGGVTIAQMRTFRALIGATNGVNTVFTTPEIFLHSPPNTEAKVYYNGQRVARAGDYTVSESGGIGTGFDTVTFLFAPRFGDTLWADYLVP